MGCYAEVLDLTTAVGNSRIYQGVIKYELVEQDCLSDRKTGEQLLVSLIPDTLKPHGPIHLHARDWLALQAAGEAFRTIHPLTDPSEPKISPSKPSISDISKALLLVVDGDHTVDIRAIIRGPLVDSYAPGTTAAPIPTASPSIDILSWYRFDLILKHRSNLILPSSP